MANETRIGIAAGLLIVVIASVYFFYGSRPEGEEVLVTAPTRVTAPPAIPVSKNSDSQPPARVAQAPKRPVFRSPTPINRAPARPVARDNGALAMNPTAGSPAGSFTIANPSQPVGAAPVASSATPLRTAPSSDLVEATWDNLTKRDSSKSTSSSPQATPAKSTPNNPQSPNQAGVTNARAPSGNPIAAISQPQNFGMPTRPTAAKPAQSTWPRRHVVVEGDTLGELARKYYGASSQSTVILAANPSLKGPKSLRIGDTLTIPEPKGTTPIATESSSAVQVISTSNPNRQPAQRTYVVRSGDTLYAISRQVYGDGSRWKQIFRANKTLLKGDPQRLKAGLVLQIPE